MLAKFTIISLFNETLSPYLNTSMMRKAVEQKIVEFNFVNLRDFGIGPHKKVDDTPYGGGDGMLLRCEPVFDAIEYVKNNLPENEQPVTIIPTPSGKIWNQETARNFADAIQDTQKIQKILPDFQASPDKILHFIILCPHYEGYDERILSIIDYKLSLGRYVLTGGELPALIFIDSIVRLLPGVLGGETSAEIESFSDGNNIEYPQYTKPETFRGMNVPEVLLSGHHGKVDEWRQKMSGTIED